MDLPLVGSILLALLLLVLAMGLWIGLGLVLVGGFAIAVFTNAPVGKIMATTIWGKSADWTMTALPMFIWMGEILFQSRLSESMFRGLAPWFSRLPGRLMHVTTVGCAMFGAVSGSSTATAATVSRVVLPELGRLGYPDRLVIGSLAGSGTLGILIPPSIIMIVYAVAAEVSIIRLFISGIIPGLLLTALFSGFIVVWSLLNPSQVPKDTARLSFREKLRASRGLLPILALIAAVFAGMFSGAVTATEVGALGVIGALLIAGFSGTLSWASVWRSAAGALRITCMIGLLIAGANVFSTAMALTGIPAALAQWVKAMQFDPYMLITALVVIYAILGTMLEGVSMILLTTSVVLPMVTAVGFDPVWFGVFIVIMTELAALSPPVGFNLFVLQAMTGRDIGYVSLASLPFFLMLVFSVAIFAVFPQIVLWLPAQVMGR
jgi:tripartite ATP-independent transporter DctM subunit